VASSWFLFTQRINKLLVGTDIEGRTVLQLVAMKGKSHTLQKVWEWAQDKLTPDEINNKFQTRREGPSCSWQQ